VNIIQTTSPNFLNAIPSPWRGVDSNTTQQEQKEAQTPTRTHDLLLRGKKLVARCCLQRVLRNWCKENKKDFHTYVTTGPLSLSRSSERTCETVHYIPLTASFDVVEHVACEAGHDNHVRMVRLQHLICLFLGGALHCSMLQSMFYHLMPWTLGMEGHLQCSETCR
jgi:hypothetical protein